MMYERSRIIRPETPPSEADKAVIAWWLEHQQRRVETEPSFNYMVPCAACHVPHPVLELPPAFVDCKYTPTFSLIASLCPTCAAIPDDAEIILRMKRSADAFAAAEDLRFGGDKILQTADLLESLYDLDHEDALEYARRVCGGGK